MAKIALSWSSGKDSAWALALLRQTPGVEVAALITTFNSNVERVAMHAVRRDLVEAQAERVSLPLWSVDLDWPCSNAIYEDAMAVVCRRAVAEGITGIAYGDLFLRDIRQYRERQLEGTGLEPLFPLWQIPTGELAAAMLDSGLKAKVTCVDSSKVPASLAGREFDARFLEELPASADPCGENGEFHTFVYSAPGFSHEIEVQCGGTVERDGFVFMDVFSRL